MLINKKDVGRRIQSIRKNKGLTLEEFGEFFGATRGNVSLWESGRSLPSNKRLKLIAEIANVHVDELLYGSLEERTRKELILNMDKNNALLPENIQTEIVNNVVERYKNENPSSELLAIEVNAEVINYRLNNQKRAKPDELTGKELPALSELDEFSKDLFERKVRLQALYDNDELANVTEENILILNYKIDELRNFIKSIM